MISNKPLKSYFAGFVLMFAVLESHSKGLDDIMHSLLAGALCHLNLYWSFSGRTLKHLKLAKLGSTTYCKYVYMYLNTIYFYMCVINFSALNAKSIIYIDSLKLIAGLRY